MMVFSSPPSFKPYLHLRCCRYKKNIQIHVDVAQLLVGRRISADPKSNYKGEVDAYEISKRQRLTLLSLSLLVVFPSLSHVAVDDSRLLTNSPAVLGV